MKSILWKFRRQIFSRMEGNHKVQNTSSEDKLIVIYQGRVLYELSSIYLLTKLSSKTVLAGQLSLSCVVFNHLLWEWVWESVLHAAVVCQHWHRRDVTTWRSPPLNTSNNKVTWSVWSVILKQWICANFSWIRLAKYNQAAAAINTFCAWDLDAFVRGIG